MQFHELIAKVAAQPLRPTPHAELTARLDKLANRIADPFHTLLTRVARHETAGLVWKSWTLAAAPTFRQGAVCLGLLSDGAAVWHSLTSNPLGKATRAAFGEETPLGEFVHFVAVTSDLTPPEEPAG